MEYLEGCLKKVKDHFNEIIIDLDKKINSIKGNENIVKEKVNNMKNLIPDRIGNKIGNNTLIMKISDGNKFAEMNPVTQNDINKIKNNDITFIPSFQKITTDIKINRNKLIEKKNIKKICGVKILKDSSINVEYNNNERGDENVKFFLKVNKCVSDKYTILVVLRYEIVDDEDDNNINISEKMIFIKNGEESKSRTYFNKEMNIDEFFENGAQDVEVIADIYLFGFE